MANFTRGSAPSKRGIMVWLALRSDGQSKLIRCPPTVDSVSYQTSILTPSLSFIKGGRASNSHVWFQQDNASPHVSRSTTAWMAQKGVRVLPNWPPNSPDLNVVEHAWAWIARKLVGKTFPTDDALWDGVQDAWAEVPASFVAKLWESIPRRLEAVRKAKGNATRY